LNMLNLEGRSTMKRLVLGMISAVALAAIGAAQAADLPVKAPVLKAAPADPYDPWTGFYFGGNVGYSWGGWNSFNPPANTLAAAGFGNFGPGLRSTANPGLDGWVAGLQGGYNWHIQPNWVLGLEGDFQWTGERASNNGQATLLTIPFRDGTLTGAVATANAWKLDWLATVRARAGYLFAPQWLVYGTGGVALSCPVFQHHGEHADIYRHRCVHPDRHRRQFRNHNPDRMDGGRRHRKPDLAQLERQARIHLRRSGHASFPQHHDVTHRCQAA